MSMIDLFQVLVFFGIILTSMAAVWTRRFRRPTLKNSSVLLSFFTEASKLMPLREEVLTNGAGHVSFFVQRVANRFKNTSTSIDIVYLPFSTDMRLLAIPKSGGIQLNPSLGDSHMEPVVLEGDFVNYFTLYSNKNQGVQSRYFLDPATMAYVVDFCRDHYWELVHNELIFVTETGMKQEDIVTFVEQLRPAIEVPASSVDQDVRSELKSPFLHNFLCPICKIKTQYKQRAYTCPNGHGSIVSGGKLAQLGSEHEGVISVAVDTTSIIECPNCSQQMTKLRYKHGLMIDSCVSCPYRWLDKGEYV